MRERFLPQRNDTDVPFAEATRRTMCYRKYSNKLRDVNMAIRNTSADDDHVIMDEVLPVVVRQYLRDRGYDIWVSEGKATTRISWYRGIGTVDHAPIEG